MGPMKAIWFRQDNGVCYTVKENTRITESGGRGENGGYTLDWKQGH